MPLDDGAYVDIDHLAGSAAMRARSRRRRALNRDVDLGAALRDLRLALNLSLEDVSRATKVSIPHIEALENSDVSRLPARPFALGYLTAYAEALGVDPSDAAARFKAQSPRVDTELRAPAGLAGEARRQFGGVVIAAAAALLAVFGWNLSRHAGAAPASPEPPRAAAERLAAPIAGPARLGAPLPAPPEASTPPMYQTPGLAIAAAAGGSADAVKAADQAQQAAQAALLTGLVSGPAGDRFAPAGRVFGAGAPAGLILQARAPTTLIVRGQDGAVYFARQLAAGEAWRAPALPGLTAEVGEPQALEVFEAGLSRGVLTRPQTALDKLAG